MVEWYLEFGTSDTGLCNQQLSVSSLWKLLWTSRSCCWAITTICTMGPVFTRILCVHFCMVIIHCSIPMLPIHYGKHVNCRVQKSLPSAKFRALGKDLLCRAPHSAKDVFVECLALGKGRHSAKIGRGLTASSDVLFAECPPFGTRQNIFFSFLSPIFFEALVHYHKQHV